MDLEKVYHDSLGNEQNILTMVHTEPEWAANLIQEYERRTGLKKMDEKRKPIGMYGETPRVKIGQYSLSIMRENSIWIEHEDGEGGEFEESDLEAVVHAFYKKHF